MGKAESQSAELADRASQMSRSRENDHEAPRILVVDDTPGNLFAFRELLGPLGYPLFEATSGDDAMARVASSEFAVILLDVMMPGMDGFETLSRMRRRALIPSTPVIMITARELNRAEIDRAYALGVIDFLTKPVYPEVLRGKVAACVSLYVANRELRRREAALSMKDRQIAVLAHDLRNPLDTVTAAVHLLARVGAADQARREQLHARIDHGLTRMGVMIRDLLDYARAGSGAIPIVRERIDLAELARDLVDEFRLADPDRRIALTGSGDTTGAWDRTRLYQALSNLVGNATHYGHGSASVSVVGRSGHVEISVRNGGPPISPELLPVIFEPFRRGDGDGAGLGLGLYIVRAIAQAHGGDVTVASSADQGTTFTLRLRPNPSAKTEASDSARPPTGPTRVGSVRAKRLRTRTGASRPESWRASFVAQCGRIATVRKGVCLADLLIVDDDRDAAGALADLMRDQGHDVRVGYDGKDGLRLAREQLPDLALIDVQMPVVGGPGMVHGMSFADLGLESVPVIFMSGLSNIAEIAAQVGTPYYLRKPFALDQVEALVEHALKESRPPDASKVRTRRSREP